MRKTAGLVAALMLTVPLQADIAVLPGLATPTVGDYGGTTGDPFGGTPYAPLLAYWKMSEASDTTRADSVKLIPGLDALVVDNGAFNVTQVAGKLGNATRFDASTSSDILRTTAGFGPATSMILTRSFVFWFWAAASTDRILYLEAKLGDATPTRLYVRTTISGGGTLTVNMLVRKFPDGTDQSTCGISMGIVSSLPRWSFLAVLYDDSTGAPFYIPWSDASGSLVAGSACNFSGFSTGQHALNGTSVEFGSNTGGQSQMDLDDFAVYDPRLTPGQVSWLWNSGNGRALF